jgi:ATP-dependent DNA helicase RecG
MPSLYNIRIENLKGVGKKRAELFNKLGVYSVGQLLNFYPRTYEDWSEIRDIADVDHGEVVCIKGQVYTVPTYGYTRTGKFISKLQVADESGVMEVIFFNNRYISHMLKYGETYCFYGKVSRTTYGIQMTSPEFSKENSTSIFPIYALTAGLTNRIVSNAVKQALAMLPPTLNDPLPQDIREKYNLVDLKYALNNIHFPEDPFALAMAKNRLITEELLVLNLGLRQLRHYQREKNTNLLHKDYSAEFENSLPYNLTNAQKRAIADCISDMTNPDVTLNRLVQGDVGSGKTAVSASVSYSAIKNGMQVAFMAPTELLAEQHYNTFKELFKNTDITVSLLTGSLKVSEKNSIRESLEDGETDIIIGTHALITDKTIFNNLGLVITDEQHRFGVAQRAKLLAKGNNPHLLVMSATPIPRTLGLIIYGDLDISIIDELPPGRQEIETLLITEDKRQRAFKFIRSQINEGKQAYIVCPLVEEGESDLASTEEYAAELMLNYFGDIPIGILHGKMKSAQKEQVMEEFSENEIKILVATTVIEVGIDVPNATIMMIENAERFGLSQLHQLRGRVGRGKDKSYCILVSNYDYEPSFERLKTMCATCDGFKIADADLKLRGPGDFFGSRQHGLPELSISSLADSDNLALSQKMADYIIADSHFLTDDRYRGLKAEVVRLFKNTGNGTMN